MKARPGRGSHFVRKYRKLLRHPRRFLEDSWVAKVLGRPAVTEEVEAQPTAEPTSDLAADGEEVAPAPVPLDLSSVAQFSSRMPVLIPLVTASQLLREPYEPSRHRAPQVIVAGRRWRRRGAAEICSRDGMRVIAYLAEPGEQADSYDGIEVVRSVDLDRMGDVPILFTDFPKKAAFGAAPPAPQKCWWLNPPLGWKLHSRRSPDLLERFGSQLERVACMLEDDASRETLGSIVRARLEGRSGYFRIASYPEYEHPAAMASRGDIVIDGGAFDGDSSRAFARQVGSEGRVLALEPSHQNFVALCRSSADEGLGQIIPMCQGLWSEPGVLSFHDGAGSSSKISDEGTSSIAVVSVDALVEQHRLPRVDLLKLDVEGAEGAVLRGARSTLERCRPKLHISVYHRPNDIHEIPLLLREWLPRYRFWLGHHNFYHTETDLYAVPEERLAAVP